MLLHLTGIALEIAVIRRYRPYRAEILETVRAVTGVSILEILHFLMLRWVVREMLRLQRMSWLLRL